MSNKIQYTDLTEKIATDSGVSKDVIHELNKQMVEELKESLAKDGQTHLSGFGTFHMVWNEAKEGHNPQTGELLEIPAHNHIAFRPDASVRRFINRDYQDLKPITLGADGKPKPEEKRSKIPFWIWILIALLFLSLAYVILSSGEAEREKMEKRGKVEVIYESNTKEVDVFASIPLVKSGTEGGEYTIKKGDDLWDVADKFYHDKYLWPTIYEANMDILKDPDLIKIGHKLIVPSFDGEVKHWTKKELNEIAESHIQVYLVYHKLKKPHARYYLWIAYHADKAVYDKYLDQIAKEDKKAMSGIEDKMEL